MKYKVADQVYIVRLEKGEELVKKLTELVKQTGIRFATVTGIGATDKVSVGLFDPKTQEYHKEEMNGNFEILHLSGNVSSMNNEPYLHLHITLSNEHHQALGGHLNYAYISATAEICLHSYPVSVGRFRDESIGLNLLDI